MMVDKSMNPFYSTNKETLIVSKVVYALGVYKAWLLNRLERHWASFNRDNTPNHVIKSALIQNVNTKNKDFMAAFLYTQHFDTLQRN